MDAHEKKEQSMPRQALVFYLRNVDDITQGKAFHSPGIATGLLLVDEEQQAVTGIHLPPESIPQPYNCFHLVELLLRSERQGCTSAYLQQLTTEALLKLTGTLDLAQTFTTFRERFQQDYKTWNDRRQARISDGENTAQPVHTYASRTQRKNSNVREGTLQRWYASPPTTEIQEPNMEDQCQKMYQSQVIEPLKQRFKDWDEESTTTVLGNLKKLDTIVTKFINEELPTLIGTRYDKRNQ